MSSAAALHEVTVHAQFEFVLGGRRERRDVLDAASVSFDAVDVVRVPSSWKHKRNYEGYYWAATTGAHVWFESLYERAALMRFDRDATVVGVAAQPMWIHWPQGAGKHAPDFFVRYRNGSCVLVDVKPASEIEDDDVETFRRTAKLCKGLGWGYEVVSDISSGEHRNLRFLSGYRYERWASLAAIARFRELSGSCQRLSEWEACLGDLCEAPLGVVYSALWWGALDFDIRGHLSLNTIATAV